MKISWKEEKRDRVDGVRKHNSCYTQNRKVIGKDQEVISYWIGLLYGVVVAE